MDYPRGPNVIMCPYYREAGDSEVRDGDMTMEAEVRVMLGYEPRNVGSLQMLEKAWKWILP